MPMTLLAFSISLSLLGSAKRSTGIMLLSLFITGIALMRSGRSIVKQHALLLQNRQSQLEETEDFLREIVPDVDLYQEKTIDELIR